MTKISNQYSLTNILTADLANSRLGINNVSPTVALDVTGAARVSGVLTGSSAAVFSGNITADGGTPVVLTGTGTVNIWGSRVILRQNGAALNRAELYSDNGIQLTANSGFGVVIPNGNVGIGTTSPTTYIDGSTGLAINGSARGVLSLIGTSSTADEVLGRLLFTNTNTTNAAKRLVIIDGVRGADNNSGYLTFSTANNGAPTERMRITSDGNVGIGTSSPSYSLHVQGNAYAVGHTGGYITASSGFVPLYNSSNTQK